ncbi:MAG: sulfite exporter TauE/SafE family protein [Cyanobacteriota bacterium]|nr:sulfite exporter TauE/SafE family protein [Cyanobacteriota bacterium]
MNFDPLTAILLLLLGTCTGLVAGVLGIGGGLLMVPVLMAWGVPILEATATSLVCVLLSAISGSWRNWQSGQLQVAASLSLALGGFPAAQFSAWLGDRLPGVGLAFGFAGLQLLAIYLMGLRRKLQRETAPEPSRSISIPKMAGIGVLAGLLSGLFGIGGGLVMVPLQMLFLGFSIKPAVRTSLGAIVPIAASGLIRHSYSGNVLWIPGLCLGLGGILGAQLGTRLLPKLPARVVDRIFRWLLMGLATYTLVKGLQAM